MFIPALPHLGRFRVVVPTSMFKVHWRVEGKPGRRQPVHLLAVFQGRAEVLDATQLDCVLSRVAQSTVAPRGLEEDLMSFGHAWRN